MEDYIEQIPLSGIFAPDAKCVEDKMPLLVSRTNPNSMQRDDSGKVIGSSSVWIDDEYFAQQAKAWDTIKI